MVQPIDMQSLIGNIMSADRVQHIVERQASVEQQRIAFQEHADRAQQETQVRQTQEAESERIEEEQERERERQSRGRSRDKQEEAQPDEQPPPQENPTAWSGRSVAEQPPEVRTVYNVREQTEDLSGTEGHNLDVRV